VSAFARAVRLVVIALSGMAVDAASPHDHALVARLSGAVMDWRKEEDERIARAQQKETA
jgi:hypothetical protein